MKRLLRDLGDLLHHFVDEVFISQVREGALRPRTWPRGLPAIGAGALVIYGALGLAAVFAVQLRRRSELVVSSVTDTSLPQPVIWLLVCGVILAFALVHTAALHTSWLWRIVLFILGVMALVFFVGPLLLTAPLAMLVAPVLYLGLLGFTIGRARASFAWWEFPVVTVIVAATMLSPWMFGGQGLETRVIALDGTFSSLGILAYPALLVAGSVPASIAISSSVAIARYPTRRLVLAIVGVAAVGLLAFATIRGIRTGADVLRASSFIASTVALLVVAGLTLVWLWRARQASPEDLEPYPDAWSEWLYPVAAAIAGMMIVITPVLMVSIVLRFLHVTSVANGIDGFWALLSANNPAVFWRAAIGCVLLVVAWRISSRGRLAEATIVGALSTFMIIDALGLVPAFAFLHDWTTGTAGLIGAGVAVLTGVVLAIRRKLGFRQVTWLLVVVLLAAVYPFRNILADPMSAALGFSVQLLLIFALTWQLITGEDFMLGDSPTFPHPTRVLLFMANSVFAVTTVAFVALSRAQGTVADTNALAIAGGWMLGDPLFMLTIVTGIWLALSPQRRHPPPQPEFDAPEGVEEVTRSMVEPAETIGNSSPSSG